MGSKIKIAIIGLGHIGKIHIEAIQNNKNYELIAVCDKNRYFKKLIEKSNFFESYEEMLDRGGFEVVVVATPNKTHSTIAKDILSKGYNVILEKPATSSLEELQSLEKITSETKNHIYYSFHASCASEVLWFKNYYTQNKKEFGTLQGFYSTFFDPYFIDNSLVDFAKGLETPWMDSGVNALSVIDCFLETNKLNISSFRVKENSLQNISSIVKFDIIEGNFGIIDTSWDQGKNFKSTELYFENNKKIILNHTTQQVFSVISGVNNILNEFKGERLLNHYINIFTDYEKSLKANSFNSNQSLQIHKKLFEVGIK